MKGGKRSGAGRPKGSPNKNQAILRDYAQKIAVGGTLTSPLDLMLETMRHLLAQATDHEAGNTVFTDGEGEHAKSYTSMQLRMMAVEVAAKAAPFVHPKLANVGADLTGQISIYEASLLALAKDDATVP